MQAESRAALGMTNGRDEMTRAFIQDAPARQRREKPKVAVGSAQALVAAASPQAEHTGWQEF